MFALSVQIISGLDSQRKFQMFTLFSGSHVGVPLEVHQHVGSILGKIFREILEDRENVQTYNLESVLIIYFL